MQPQTFHPDSNHTPHDDEPVSRPTIEADHIKPNHLGSPRRPWGRYVFTVIVFIGLAVASWFGYRWYENTMTTQAQLKESVADLQKQNSALQAQPQPSVSSSASDLYKVDELGIEFTTNDQLKGLVYAYDQKTKTALFTTRSLSYQIAVENKTDTTKLSGGELGAIVIMDKEPAANSGTPSEKVATLSDGRLVFYVVPQNKPTDNKALTAELIKTQTEFKKALASTKLVK